jgi:hypothetical protein
MIGSIKKKIGHPLSFISSVTGYINKLSETLEAQHKALEKTKTLDAKTIDKLLTQITKDSESILLCREQLHKWNQTTHSNFQRQKIARLEKDLSKVTKLNGELYKLVIIHASKSPTLL